MIDLDDLERNLDWHDAMLKNHQHGVIYSLDYNEKDSIRELISRLRQAEKDAARYRWLRDSACYNEFHAVGAADPSVWNEIVDEYIDEEAK